MKLSTFMGLIEATYSEFNSVGFNDAENNHVTQHSSLAYTTFLRELIKIVEEKVKEE
jgi:hypothetical protein